MGWMDEYNKALKKYKKEPETQKTTTTKSTSSATSGSKTSQGSWMDEYNKSLDKYQSKKASDVASIRESITSRMTTRHDDDEEEKEKKWYDGFLQIGKALSDGYDRGDIAKTLIGTNADVLSNLASGVVGWGEDAIDAGAIALGTLAEKNGWIGIEEKLREFAASELYDENEVARKILKASGTMAPMGSFSQAAGAILRLDDWLNLKEVDNGFDGTMIVREDNSIFGDQSDALIQSAGETAVKKGLTAATGIPVGDIITGVTVYGSQAEQALREDATFAEASGSGLISAGAEIMFEKLSGGIKIGGSTLDEGLTRLISKNISNVALKTALNYGLDISGEALEEVATEFVGKLGTKLYKEEDLAEILFSEDALRDYCSAAFGGMLMGGAFNIHGAVSGVTNGVDYKTGRTANEQTVINHEVEKRIAEQEKGDKKLTAKEKKNIEEAVIRDLEKGYITIDSIEEALGGKTYEQYKQVSEWEDSLQKQLEDAKKEYKDLHSMKRGDMTGEQLDREAELQESIKKLETQVKNVLATSGRSQLKQQLSDEVRKLAQGDRLVESYLDKERSKQRFTADLSKYDAKQRQHIQDAIDSGVLHNGNRAHEIVDFTAKVSSDTGIPIRYTNTEKIKAEGLHPKRTVTLQADGKTTEFDLGVKKLDSGFKPVVKVGDSEVSNYTVDFENGKIKFENAPAGEVSVTVEGTETVDAIWTGKEIILNVKSPRYLQALTGHEITHRLEKAGNYENLAKAVKSFAEAKGEWEDRVNYRKSTHKGVNNADAEMEAIADLIGEYLFKGNDFITELSVKDRNVFQKIYDEIKYLCKVVTAGSKEARELERVKHEFEKAYRAGASTQSETDTKYSLVTDKETLDFLDNQEQVKVFRAMQLIDGELYPPMAAKVKDESGKKQLVEPTKQNTWYQADERPDLIKFEVKQGKKTRFLTAEEMKKNASVLYGNPSADDVVVLKDGSTVKYGDLKYKYELDKANGSSVPAAYNPYFHTSMTALNDQFSSAYDRPNLVVVEGYIPKSELTSGYQAMYAKDSVGETTWHAGPVASKLKGDKARRVFLSRWFKTGRIVPDAEAAKLIAKTLEGENLSVPWNVVTPSLRNALEVEGVTIDYNDIKAGSKTVSFESTQNNAKYSLSDSDGKQLTKEQQDYFKDSKMRDENGNLKVMYHGSQDAGFHVFDSKMSDDDTSFFFVDRNDVAASYSGTSETYEAKTIRSAEDINNFLAEIGYDHYEAVERNGKFELLENGDHVAWSDTAQGIYEEFCWYEGVGEGDANYKVYLNLKNPLEVDAQGRNWDRISNEFSQKVYDRYQTLTAEEKAALTDLAEWEDFSLFKDELTVAPGKAESPSSDEVSRNLWSAIQKLENQYGELDYYQLFDIASDGFTEESLRENANEWLKTRDYAQRAKEQGYDGVIFKNIVDIGGYGGDYTPATVAIAFDSNQIKSTANAKPTEDADIRYSISEEQNEQGLDRASEVQFSLSNDTAYMDKAIAMNNSVMRVDSNVMTETKAMRERIAARMNAIKDRGLVGLPEDIEGNTYIANSSYDGTEENTTICPRSLASEAFVDAVSEYLGRPLSVEEQIYISQDLQGRILTPECTYCYVATDRKAYRAFLGEYVAQRDAVLQKVKDNPFADVSRSGELYKEFLNGRKDTNPMYSRFKMWVDAYKNGKPMIDASHLANINKLMGDINSEFGAELKPQIVDAMKYAQSASWAKKRVNYVAYNGHILNWKQDRINKLNSHYGLRMYSFSDFHPAFVLENMQMITDASVRGLKMLGYTKDTDFVDIFAPSGMNINISTFGFEAGGNVYENNLIGAEWEKAKALREQYPNVGITFVATNDTLVDWALNQDWIDVVIPFHLVRTGREVAKAFNYHDYTSESSDTKTKDWKKGDKKYIAPTDHNNDKATYLAALEKNHLKPRFERFISNPNYMKLVNECRRPFSESKPVQPVFNEDAAMVALAKLEANGYYQPVGGSVDRMYEIAGEVAEAMTQELAPAMSLSFVDEETPLKSTYGATLGKDVRLETAEESSDVAPVSELVTENTPTVSEMETIEFPDDGDVVHGELERLTQQKTSLEERLFAMSDAGEFGDEFNQLSEEWGEVSARIADLENSISESESGRIDSLTDADMPPETDAPYYGESDPDTVSNPFENRDWYEVGTNRSTRAFMVENPEFQPFFQQEAWAMLVDLGDTQKAERWYNDELHYTSGGEKGFGGQKRFTSQDIATLLDDWGLSYAQIEEGLTAIAENNSKVNNAPAKRIEFMLNNRLLNGYKDFHTGQMVPPNQEYQNMIREWQVNQQARTEFDSFMPMADQYAPEEIAPVLAKATPDTVDAPVYESKDGQITMFETEEPKETAPTTRKELHQRIVENIKTVFSGKGFDFDKVLRNAKNLSTFATVDNTPQRVMEKALGYKQGGILADITVNQVAQNESAGIKWLNNYVAQVKRISRQYHIKPGSNESAAAQMYAEGFYVDKDNNIVQYGDRELAIDFPNPKVRANIKGLAGDARIRQIYDETLSKINESRTRNAYPEIPRLDNYFLHFRAMEDTFSRMGLPFNPNDIRAKDLPTDLNGVTADLKPGQPYFASAMHREGKRTSFDLLGGLEKYLNSAKNQIYHIDDIQTLRALRNYIADTYGQAKGLENLDELSQEAAYEQIQKVYDGHLSTFAKFLNEEANVLAGKTALIDRGLEGVIGRRGMTFLNTLNGQVGSNMVGYNISSSLTNFLPVVQTFAKTNKADFTKAFAQTVANKLSGGKFDSFAEDSPVVIRRKGADRFHQTFWQKMQNPGYVLMGAVDSVSTELIARTKYNEFIKKGMDSQQAHFETDKWVSKLMGDRSLGQQPQLYNSKLLGLVTKFQLEVRNQLDAQFYDTIQETKASNEDIQNGLLRNAKTAAKVASVFTQLAVVQHLYGMGFEKLAGYNPAFDIIEVLMTAFGFDDDEESEDTALDNIEQGFMALLEDMPYASTFLDGGRIPISSALPIEEFVKGEDQYGNEKSRWETLGEVAPYYLMPGGYGQLKKTVQGLSMFSDDHPIAGSYTDSGNLRFPVDDTLGSKVKAGIFGQYASENARKYFDQEQRTLNPEQTEIFAELDIPIEEYWEYRDNLNEFYDTKDKLLDAAYADGATDEDVLKGRYIDAINDEIYALYDQQKEIAGKNITGKKYLLRELQRQMEEKLSESKYAVNNIYIDGMYAEIGGKRFDRNEDGAWFEISAENDAYGFYEREQRAVNGFGISYSEYWNNREKYDDAYTLGKDAITTVNTVFGARAFANYASELSQLKADKDKNGNSISGSKKKKVLDYIQSLEISYGEKIVLFKSQYPKDDDYNYDIISYVDGRNDISYEDKVTVLEELGFEVDSEGNVYWD